jgi:hypothetical protein
VQLGRILRVFDSVAYDQPEYPDQPGTVLCCGLPVVMRGGSRVECGRCKRTVGAGGGSMDGDGVGSAGDQDSWLVDPASHTVTGAFTFAAPCALPAYSDPVI